MNDIERHGSIARAIAAAVSQYCRNRLTLFDWMHPDWRVDKFVELPPVSTAFARLARARGVDAWLRAMYVGVPPIKAFTGEAASLFGLPVDASLRAMRFRALHFRRAELRHWVDRDSRELLVHWLGGEASGVLRWLMERHHAPAANRLMRSYGMPPLQELNDLDLAWEGYCLFAHAGLGGASTPLELLRFVWSCDAVEPDWCACDDTSDHAEESMQVVRRLPDFFQEQT